MKEVTLLGQNVNAYRGETEDGDSGGLRAAARVRRRDSRHRALALHHLAPARVHAAADRCLRGSVPKLVSHVHLPVQSGSDRVLAAMKRGYTVLEYKSIVRRLRSRAAGHLDLLRFHRRLSGRDGGRLRRDAAAGRGASGSMRASASSTARAPARRRPICPTTTPQEVKLARLQTLQQRSKRRRRRSARRMVGTQPARAGRRPLAERIPTSSRGRTDNNRVVNFSGSAATLIGEITSTCADHRGASAFAARRKSPDRHPVAPSLRSRSKSASPRSTTSGWPTCAARSTRTCARSKPRST